MRVQLFSQLQTIDQQLTKLARERDTVLAEFTARDDLRNRYDANRELASRLKHERGRNSDLQWELEDLEERLRGLEEIDHDGPSDPLIARELTLLRERRAQLEDLVLHQLDTIAALEYDLAAGEAQLTEATAAWFEREPQLQADLDRLGDALEALQMERQHLASRLPAGALDQYDDLQRRHRGTALAPIRNRQCSACRARLPAAVFDLLNTPDALVRCPRCGRVLYSPPNDADAA